MHFIFLPYILINLLFNFRSSCPDEQHPKVRDKPKMCVYRRDTNLQDILVHITFSSNPQQEQARDLSLSAT